MANKIAEILNDIGYRIGDPGFQNNPVTPQGLVREMDRYYKAMNREYKLLKKTYNNPDRKVMQVVMERDMSVTDSFRVDFTISTDDVDIDDNFDTETDDYTTIMSELSAYLNTTYSDYITAAHDGSSDTTITITNVSAGPMSMTFSPTQHSVTFTTTITTITDISLYQFSLPDDFIRVLSFSGNAYNFRELELFTGNESDTYTIDLINQLIIFSNENGYSQSLKYESTGLTLVNKADADVLTGETNTPEWGRSFDMLFIAIIASQISKNYPFYVMDLQNIQKLESSLKSSRWNVQATNPSGMQVPTPTNDYQDPDYR